MRSRCADGCVSAHLSARNSPSAASSAFPSTDRSEYAKADACSPISCPAKSTTTLVLRASRPHRATGGAEIDDESSQAQMTYRKRKRSPMSSAKEATPRCAAKPPGRVANQGHRNKPVGTLDYPSLCGNKHCRNHTAAAINTIAVM